MIKGSAGLRFARAIFEIASQGGGDYDKWLQDLRRIQNFLNDSEVAARINNPEVPFETKKDIIGAVLASLDQIELNFVYVLVQRRGSDLIDGVVAEFQRLVNEHRGVAVAEVVTAVALDGKSAEYVAARLSDFTGKKITMNASVDPSIIGGIVARVGDKLINGSVADRLARLRDQLAQA